MSVPSPSFQFYPGDWLKDANLRRCTPATRGVWIDMLCLMFQCDERGVFATAGEPWTDEEIARALPGNRMENLSAILELLKNRVVHISDKGAFFSKRMVKDEEARRQWRERQQRHRVSGEPVSRDVTPTVTPTVTAMSRPSSSSSSSSNLKSLNPCPNPSGSDEGGFIAFWSLYPKKEAKQAAVKAWRKVKADELPTIMAGLRKAIQTEQWRKDDGQFVPLPASWLNGRRWTDELTKTGDRQNRATGVDRRGVLTEEDKEKYRQVGVQM
jgi:hypothetical protein